MSIQIRRHRFNPAPSIATLLFGIVLVAMSFMGVMSLYKSHAARKLAGELRGEGASGMMEEELQGAVIQLDLASAREPGRRKYNLDQVMILFRLYYEQKTAGRDRDASRSLKKASAAIANSLKRAPGDANLWYLAAELRAMQGKMDGKARRFLGMSYISGAHEGWIALRRLQFSLRYWLLLDDELHRFAKQEMRTLWSSPAYRRSFVRQFSRKTARVQRLIVSQISRYSEDDKQKFLKLAKGSGWRINMLSAHN